jgi:Protein of unknown function (DUF3037)
MKKTYYYSTLHYCPSIALDERINIGILYLFKEENALFFDFPNHLQRVKDLFHDADIKFLKIRLKEYAELAKNFKFDIFTKNDFSHLISQLYGQLNAGSLTFSEPNFGIYQHQKQLIDNKHELFFKNYQPEISNINQILEKLEQYFSDYKLNKELLTLKPEIDKVKFSYSWKNGSTNFIEPISFDCKKPAYIPKRANEWIGKIITVQDFFTAPPKNEKFIPAYHDALRNMQKATSPAKERVNFYQMEDVPSYMENMLAHIHD